MARKKVDAGGGGPNWLDTYADMVTLLLTFFVLLFAMSSVDSDKWQMLAKAFAGGREITNGGPQLVIDPDESGDALDTSTPIANGETGSGGLEEVDVDEVLTFDDLYAYLASYVKKNKLSDSVSVNKGDGYTFLIFRNSIFFDGDSYTLRDDGKVILDYLCNGLVNITKDIGEIRVYGHTAQAKDSDKTEQLIWDRTLSTNRANSVLMYIQFKDILDPAKMVAEGYGQYRPLVPHDGTEETRIKNRRVELYISQSGKTSSVLDSVYSDIQAQQSQP